MPKGHKKGSRKSGSPKNGGSKASGSDALCVTANNNSSDGEFSETASITSGFTDIKSIPEDSDQENEPEVSTQEDFESKLHECIENATQKSAQGRQNSFKSICMALTKRTCGEFLIERKMTLTDALERSLKKGRGEEQVEAAKVAPILCIQLGMTADSAEVYTSLRPLLVTILQDKSASLKARACCAMSLGLCTFVAGSEIEELTSVLQVLEQNFTASYLKGNGVPPTHTIDTTAMHASSLASWCLLLSIAPLSIFNDMVEKHIGRLPQLLQSTDVELRIVAGEAIAFCYELLRYDDEHYRGPAIVELCALLKELATDSSKYRAKKDRRQQRSSFRDILRTVQDNDYPMINIKFGSEILQMDSWVTKRRYDCFCSALGSGMNLHLSENDLLRDIFELGNILPTTSLKARKTSKMERQRYNAAAFKMRTKVRGKARDKRTTASEFG